MSVRFKETNPKHIEKMLKKWRQAAGLEVAVGFPTGTKGDRIHTKADIPIWQLAAIHQFGSVARGIPARDFMTPAKVPTINAIGPIMKNGIQAINKDASNIKTVLRQVARVAESQMKKSINELSSPANAQSTIDRKKGASNPLVDSTEMRNATTAVVRKATT